ncbi:phosphotransferase (plasmid) [Diaphorobacter sp. HDW4B]|uniref:phosphotransferase n=1 Tax=Diaphorobacter sp. HDW4B TaxID=2714925 RepID=UPI00140BA303|nr:phosphotransferase [Diaphorobacter sp. HDW4B]QIL73973.1 phosphotransferase [Diaphorobacter sp. HDW4B]
MTWTLERLQAVYENDQLRAHEKVYSANEIPLNYEAITAAWLTDALCKGHPGAEVVDFDWNAPDDGTSNRRRLQVAYNAAGREAALPTRIFCKASQGLANRYALGVSGAAYAESTFYNHVRPLLKGVNAPIGVFANYDDETLNSIVMVEDLTDQVTAFCDHTTSITRQLAESQIDLLARLHGQCYGNVELLAQHQRFKSWPEYFNGTLVFGMREGSEQGFARASDLIPVRLHRRAAEIWPATVKSVELAHRLPHTLAHGDVHLKNWYILRDGSMALGDWQCLSHGYWARDFAYAIGTSLTVEDRREWERDLLRRYLDGLHAAGGPKLDFSTGWLHYRQQMPAALTWWTITYNPAPGMPDMQPMAASIQFVSRLATAMDDIDTLDSLA